MSPPEPVESSDHNDAKLQSPDSIAFIGEALWTGMGNGGEVKEWKGRGQGREGGGRKGFLQTDRCLSMCNIIIGPTLTIAYLVYLVL